MRSPKGSIRTWIIFIVLILGVLAFLLYLQQKAGEEEPEVVTEDPQKQVEKVTMPKKGFAVQELSKSEKQDLDEKALSEALLSGEGCEAIKFNEELRQKCIDTHLYNEAIKKGDESICEQIADEELRKNCIDQVLLSIATKSQDKSLCEKIQDETVKQACLDQIQALSGRTAESSSDCEVIQDPTLRQTCLDNFYFSDSVKNLTEESCDNIVNLDLKDRCSATVEKNIEIIEISKSQAVRTYKTTEEELETCDSQKCIDDANYNLALENKDLAFCNEIVDSELQNQCISVNGAAINNYYLRQATSQKDPSLCNKIIDEGLRTACATYAQ